MISIGEFKKMANSFPETVELPHFERTSFRVKKKIFATLSETEATVVVKLLPSEQWVYCKIDSEMIYPVPGNWGKHGWTRISLKKVNKKILRELLNLSYSTVLGKKQS